MKLSNNNLPKINNFLSSSEFSNDKNFNFDYPKYDRKNANNRILHIGVGGFHRAHLAYYLHQLKKQDEKNTDWSITGIGLLPWDEKIFKSMKN